MSFDELLEKAREYLPPEKIALVKKAYDFAAEAHQGQMRKSGDPYIEHPLQVALSLAKLQLDADTLAAALLHDVPETCDVPISELEAQFGSEVAELVDGATKLGKLSLHAPDAATRESQAQSLRKMLVSMAKNLRVVFIKLADRLHNMETLYALSPEMQRSIAQETLEIYAPLAHRLGIWELKWRLEDLSFSYLERERYDEIAGKLDKTRGERESFITQVIQILEGEFKKAGLSAEISGRPKHFYSIYQKMKRYAALGKDFDDIYDLFALRILVGTKSDCYNALGIIHSLWRFLPGEFNDFIGSPKPNGYQALHTVVMCLGKTPLEVQIRTRDMHDFDEYGVTAHWRYKEGEKEDMRVEEEEIGWLRRKIEEHQDFSKAEEFLESVKTDLFKDQVFVFTPKGEIKDLPRGSTPLDFAYQVHTEVGHRCTGAKVNGKLVPLNYQLNNGDVVEIMLAKGDKAPSRDWLNPHLGYTTTSHAKEKIRQWFRRQERADNIERGRELLEKEMRHLGIRATEREELAKLFEYDSLDDFLAAIGYGGISPHQIAVRLSAQQEPPPPKAEVALPQPPQSAIRVQGVGNLVHHLARCCHPVPGDRIIGYVTRSRGVTIHRQDCYNVVHEDEKERLIAVEWGQTDALYPVNIQVEAWDRVGLIRDITTIVAEEGVNIASVSLAGHDNNTTSVFLTLQTKDLAQLSRLMTKIDGIRGVIGVSRVGDEATIKPRPSNSRR
jgi:GTP pyrophosphokinase